MGTPSETPTNAVRSEPAASITARTSSIRASSENPPSTLSDMPVPRLSKMIKRAKPDNRLNQRSSDGTCQDISTCEAEPGTNTTSNGPAPVTW